MPRDPEQRHPADERRRLAGHHGPGADAQVAARRGGGEARTPEVRPDREPPHARLRGRPPAGRRRRRPVALPVPVPVAATAPCGRDLGAPRARGGC